MVIGRLFFCVTAAALALTSIATAQTDDLEWVGSWATGQQLVEERNELPDGFTDDVTIHQTVSPTLAGERIRVRLSNEFGDGPLEIERVVIADATAAGSIAVEQGSTVPLTFSGAPGITIPQGAAWYSDPVDFTVTPFDDIAITMTIGEAPENQTGHPGSRTTTWFAAKEEGITENSRNQPRWYYIAGIDVLAPADHASIAVIGDSITDGYGSTTDGNDRWTDVFARRLQANPDTQNISVLNMGFGGNCVTRNCLGPNVASRIERDVIAHPNIGHVIIFEGINDLGGLARTAPDDRQAHDAMVGDIIAVYEQLIARAHAHDIKAYGATITPFKGGDYYPFNENTERARQQINDWIRNSGAFDAVLDFDAILRDPADPQRLRPEYDNDHLHPSVEGYKALAAAVTLELFETNTE
ncbi:SGNH/GDSL hydrolase family protein [Aquisalinus flavus]|uniref:SGNH hydrolase-type esterase domain-containing protein n=1 Tax=Aquisalinus flavus TaxID=1526572 RepID=A0A8J2V561_9PROT|nr:SGNH/GDSL hydrolase family protein [Aquisalinus flavus]MBD0426401.1 SGNH/GDSL hydrolase family protein [Aquisalinus flavus]UNE48040.1 SGNH/GDSL hydrolase family protein [Aquisalinus flavus]GGD08248.1 hypothetical protein GCM10011342_16350 [Aquisalinus flavus]